MKRWVKTGMEPAKDEGVGEVMVGRMTRGVREVITEGEAQTVGGRQSRCAEAYLWQKRVILLCLSDSVVENSWSLDLPGVLAPWWRRFLRRAEANARPRQAGEELS